MKRSKLVHEAVMKGTFNSKCKLFSVSMQWAATGAICQKTFAPGCLFWTTYGRNERLYGSKFAPLRPLFQALDSTLLYFHLQL